MRIVYAAIIIFAFRATPSVGEGYRWFTIDVLGFDEAFYGMLQQLGAAIAIVGAWLLSDLITRKPVPQVLLWLTVLGTVLALPTLALVFQLHDVTERLFGIGARSIALFDAAARSPLAQLGMIPLLTLIADLCPGQPSRHLVCPDGVADEPGADRRRSRHQIPEPDLPRRSRRLRQSARTGGCSDRDQFGLAARRNRAVRPADPVIPREHVASAPQTGRSRSHQSMVMIASLTAPKSWRQ